MDRIRAILRHLGGCSLLKNIRIRLPICCCDRNCCAIGNRRRINGFALKKDLIFVFLFADLKYF